MGFGEIALLYNDRRTATVKAVDECKTWVLEGKTFKNIIIKATVQKRNIELGFLERVQMFSNTLLMLISFFIENLDRYEKLKLIDGLESKTFIKGECMIKEGEEGDYFYIIEQGEVECVKDPEDPSQDKIHVRDLSRGEHFGELALINNVKRTLSVRAKSDLCKVLAL